MPEHTAQPTGPIIMQQQPVEMVPAGGQVQAGNVHGAPAAGSPPQG